MASAIALKLTANGEAMIAESSRAFNTMKANAKSVAQETGKYFSDDLKAGLREAEATAKASFKSIQDVVASAVRTNGAVQFDVAGAKAATAAAQDRLAKLQALATAQDALIAKEGQASAATRTYAAAIQASIAEERENISILNNKAAVLEHLQAELGQTAVQQSRVTAVSGQTRAGMQQLSFQVSDVAASFVNGVSPMVIFSQQSGQVIQALGMMGTKATGFLAVMGNPWFLAITSALTVLGTLIFKSDTAAQTFDFLTERTKIYSASNDVLAASIDEVNGRMQAQNRTALQNAEVSKVNTQVLRGELTARLEAAKAIQEQSYAMQILNALSLTGGNLTAALTLATAIRKDAFESIDKLELSIRKIDKITLPLIEGKISKALKEEAEDRERVAKAAEKEATAKEKAANATQRTLTRPSAGSVLSPFGADRSGVPFGGRLIKGRKHEGVDIAGKIGDAVVAPEGGIAYVKRDDKGLGLYVEIKADSGARDLLGHLSAAKINSGDRVTAGQLVGLVGDSGNAQGGKPHLHWQRQVGKKWTDPMKGVGATAAGDINREQEEIERALKRQEEAHKHISDQLGGDIAQLQTIKAVEDLRAQGKELEAEQLLALNQLQARFSDLMTGDVATAAKVLGMTEDRVKALRELYAIAEKLTVEGVNREHQAKLDKKTAEKQEKAQKELEQSNKERMDREKREAEQQFRDLASFYERAFRSGGKSIWSDFKNLGRRVLSELAAQATISLLGGGSAGGQGGGFFSGIGNLLGINGGGGSGGGGFLDKLFSNGWSMSANGSAGGGGAAGGIAGLQGALGPIAAAVSINQGIGKLLGVDQKKHGMLLSLLVGPFFAKMIGSTLRGSATLGFTNGELGVGETRGNSKKRIEGASNAVNSLSDMIEQISEALGGSISGAGSVSIGIRKKMFVVDPTGKGRTKGSGVLRFKTEQEAIEAAMRDALQDGVINGISDAAKKILQSGGSLQKAIEKAAMIEAIPKALKARLNPVGAALDELNDKWDKYIKALKEGGATAEQLADAEKLYKLEREDALKAANDNLKDFIASLNYGSSSNYSLPDQLEKLRADLSPLLANIGSGNFAAIDQQRYLALAGQDLDILRQIEGSGPGYFNRVDELRTATQRLADGLSASTAEAARDPFAQATATATASTAENTLATAEMLEQTNLLLAGMNERLANLEVGAVSGGFIGSNRLFVDAA